jgi:hypothetical protein
VVATGRRVLSPFDRAGGRADNLDARLARQVRHRLGARDPGVRAEVQNGVAVLTGTVESAEERRAAVRVTRSVPGVRDVCNAMCVIGDADPAGGIGAAERDDDRVFAEIIAAVLAPARLSANAYTSGP